MSESTQSQVEDATQAGMSVLPPIPYTPIPTDIAKKFPALDRWNRDNHYKLEEWRRKAVVAMGGRI